MFILFVSIVPLLKVPIKKVTIKYAKYVSHKIDIYFHKGSFITSQICDLMKVENW